MNTESIDQLIAEIKQKAEAIVKQGGDVQAEISKLVSDVTSQFYQTRDGLEKLVKAVAEGAATTAKESFGEDKAESVLLPVVNGLADGLAKSAQAVRLTLEESSASGRQFARADLENISKDFRVIGEVFVDIVSDAASKLGGHVTEQVRTIGEHAKQTFLHVWSPLEKALNDALHDPVKLGRESVQVGASVAQQAAGVLFSELGKHLQHAGEKLRR
jgi:hypothetical protein